MTAPEPHPLAPSRNRKDRAPVVHCVICDPTGRGRMCARKACYCGHPECWAFDSYRKPVRARIPGEPGNPAPRR